MDINVMEFIRTESLWLIPVLMILGYVLKQIPRDFFPDWLIPIALYIIGMISGFFLISQNAVGILQGLLCATASIGVHQGVKQSTKKE